jgi:hypothetical protein
MRPDANSLPPKSGPAQPRDQALADGTDIGRLADSVGAAAARREAEARRHHRGCVGAWRGPPRGSRDLRVARTRWRSSSSATRRRRLGAARQAFEHREDARCRSRRRRRDASRLRATGARAGRRHGGDHPSFAAASQLPGRTSPCRTKSIASVPAAMRQACDRVPARKRTARLRQFQHQVPGRASTASLRGSAPRTSRASCGATRRLPRTVSGQTRRPQHQNRASCAMGPCDCGSERLTVKVLTL